MVKRRFFFHYNKPASQSAKKPLMSVHFKNTCYIVDSVVCKTICESKVRPRQPRIVMQGFTSEVTIKNGVATIS